MGKSSPSSPPVGEPPPAGASARASEMRKLIIVYLSNSRGKSVKAANYDTVDGKIQ